jgi:SAM-dependent methyltransferase
MPDRCFAEPRLADIYDDLDPNRSDLDVYMDLVEEMGSRSVLDVGCGTGTFACMLAKRGLDVTAIDPAQASLDVAQRKPYADRVRWLLGDATSLPKLHVDLAIMTANVAQVFLTDDEWSKTLRGVAEVLNTPPLSDAHRHGGRLVFEVRDPTKRAWESWNRRDSYVRVAIEKVGVVETWVDVLQVHPPYVTFRHTYRFEESGETLTSDSTLRFRERSEIESSLRDAGFRVVEVRGAPDRPGLEFVFIAEVAKHSEATDA